MMDHYHLTSHGHLPHGPSQMLLVVFCMIGLVCVVPTTSNTPTKVTSTSGSMGTFPTPRRLAVGDFESINQVLSETTFTLPSMSQSEGTTTLNLSNISCRNVNVGDVRISRDDTSNLDLYSVELSIVNLDLICDAQYRYSGLLMSGNGDVTVTSSNNNVKITGAIISESSSEGTAGTAAPTSIILNACNPSVQIDNINFDDGGFVGWVLNLVEGLARGIMEKLVEDLLCDELEKASTKAQELLLEFNDKLNLYPVDLVVDPLQSEKALLSSSTSVSANEEEEGKNDDKNLWLDLSSPKTTLGKWVRQVLDQGIDYLQRNVTVVGYSDPQMQGNVWIREWLNEDLGLVVLDPTSDEPWPIFYQHDVFLETSIQVTRLQILGLDTLTNLNPLEILGKHTLQSHVAWQYLSLEVDAIIEIQPSSLDGAAVTGSVGYTEKLTVALRLDDIQATVAILAAIQIDILESLRLGSLMTKANVLPCLLSTLSRLEFSAFTIDAGDISTPRLSPFESPGLYRILNQVLDTIFDLYETSVLERAPAIFQQDFRASLNEQLNTFYLTVVNGGAGCPAPVVAAETSAPESFVDFRDLLLNPFEAWYRGATGEEPYGDLIPSLITPGLESQLMTAELFNIRLIGSATKAQSGEAGTFHWPNAVLMNYTNSESAALHDTVVIKASNLRIHNLDIVEEPLNILDARDWNALYQTISFASDDRPLKLMTRFQVVIGDDPSSPLAMENQWDLSIEIPAMSMELGILAQMKETSLLQFPLVDMANPYCWLATLEAFIDKKENGESISLLPLTIETLGLALSMFELNAKCIKCTSPGAPVLGELLQLDLPAAGFQDVFTTRIVTLAEDLMKFYWNGVDFVELMEQAKSQCPHQTVEASPSTVDVPWARIISQGISLQAMSPDSLDTIVGLAVVVMEVAVAGGARNHVLLAEQRATEDKDVPIEIEETYPEELDWTNLSATMGDWTDFAFDEVRKYLLAPVSTMDDTSPNTTVIQLVQLLKENVVEENGALNVQLPINDGMFDGIGLEILNARMEIMGLETLSVSDMFVPVQPRVLRNSFALETLSVALHATVKIGPRTEDVRLLYSMKNLSIAFDLFVSVNVSSIQAIEIGSIFNMEDILPCISTAIEHLQLGGISSSVGDLEGPVLSGFFGSDFQESIESILTSLVLKYHNETVAAFPIFLDTSFKDIVNGLMPKVLVTIQNACPSPQNYPKDSLVDFRELLLPINDAVALGAAGQEPYGDLFHILYALLDKKVLQAGASNRPLINDIFRHLTSAQSNKPGTFIVENDVLNSQTRVKIAGLDAEIGLQVLNLTVENVDSVGDPLEVANPMVGQPSVVSNTLSFGVDSRPVKLATSVVFSISDGAEMSIRNELQILLTLEDVRIMADVLLMISERSFSRFPIGDLNNINCWLATVLSQPFPEGPAFRGIGLEHHDLSIGNFSLEVTCTDCTSPDFDKLILSMYNFNNATELEDAIRRQSESIFDSDFFPLLLDSIMAGSAKRCPHNVHYDPDTEPFALLSPSSDSLGLLSLVSSTDTPSYFRAVNVSIAIILFAIGFLVWLAVKRRNRKWIESLNQQGMTLFTLQQEKERRMQAKLDSETPSLFACPEIPLRVRYGIPVAIVLNIAIYLGGHLGVLSIVNIDAAVAGEEFSINRFLEFRFIESTRDTYSNGGKEMAILLWIFTGIWPYVKLVGSLLVWILPPSYLSVQRRGQVLLWIDALAKLSVIDIITILIGFAALLVFIGGQDQALSYSATTFYAFKVVIVPKAGFYCLIIAQRMSRVSSRFLLEYHDILIAHATKTVGDDEGHDGSVIDPSGESGDRGSLGPFSDFDQKAIEESSDSSADDKEMPHEEASKRSKQDYRWGTIGVICGALTIFVVFVIGCILAPAISLDTTSFAGIATESGMTYEELVSKFGVFLVMSSILVRVSFVLDAKADYIGLGFLLLVGLVSVACVFFLQVYHFIKRKLTERRDGRKLPLFGHRGCGLPFYLGLYKYRHMEIFLISVAVGVWQLGSACSYAIYLYCEVLRQLFTVMEILGLVDESSAQCSRIQASLPENLCILGGSVTLLLAAFGFQAASQYKKNIDDALRFVDDDDLPSLSLAWSSDRSKNSRYSRRTMSMDEFSDEIHSVPLSSPLSASTVSSAPLCRDDRSPSSSIGPPPINPSLRQGSTFETSPSATPSACIRRAQSARFEDVESGDENQPAIPLRSSLN